MKFFYEKFTSSEGDVYYPSFNIKVINPKTSQVILPYKVLVDSGASVCLFHGWLGDRIGIDIKKGEKKMSREQLKEKGDITFIQ